MLWINKMHHKKRGKALEIGFGKIVYTSFHISAFFFLLRSQFALPSLCCERIKKLFHTFETIVENLFEQDAKTIPNKLSFMRT